MRHSFLCGAAFFGLTALAVAEPPGAAIKGIQPTPGAPVVAAPEPAPIIKLAASASAHGQPALKYMLLPDPLDLTAGNAAPLWIRAGSTAHAVNRTLVEGPYKGIGGPVGTPLNFEGKHLPLKDLPKEEIRTFLAKYATALRIADQAARCDHCDWEFPPFKIGGFDYPMEEIQLLRTMAALLTTRFRLELSEGRFDDALHTLQTGFALSRDIGKGGTLIHDLVAIAVGGIMFGNVEEWMQTPGSPNLFWALTDLPCPLVNIGPAMRNELTTLYRTFPPLRQLIRDSDKGAMSEEETNKVVSELFKIWSDLEGSQLSDWQKKLAIAALAIKVYPEARKYLLEQGRKPEQLDAMPTLQVVLLYYVDDYDQLKDEVLKWTNVPPWEARAGLDATAKKIRDLGPTHNPIVSLLIPAIAKVYEARVRIERTADYLCCAESLRMYAATHDGKAPEKLEDVKLPLPLDPATGQGFGKFYKVEKDGTAVLEIPPPPPIALPSFGRRFELTPKH
jgi:tetratricopeptide (TPR) repeat protein